MGSQRHSGALGTCRCSSSLPRTCTRSHGPKGLPPSPPASAAESPPNQSARPFSAEPSHRPFPTAASNAAMATRRRSPGASATRAYLVCGIREEFCRLPDCGSERYALGACRAAGSDEQATGAREQRRQKRLHAYHLPLCPVPAQMWATVSPVCGSGPGADGGSGEPRSSEDVDSSGASMFAWAL